MTTGVVSQPGQSVTTTVGTAWVGSMFYKSWSGNDQPKSLVRYPNVYSSKNPFLSRKYTKPPRRALQYAEHPYTCSIRYGHDKVIRWRNSYDSPTTVRTATSRQLRGNPSFLPPDPTSDQILAALGKLREEIAFTDFNLGVFLGESQKALRTVADRTTSIYHAIRNCRRGRFSDALYNLTNSRSSAIRNRKHASSKEAADMWLELQYGWLPMLKDIHGGTQFIAHALSTPLKMVYRSGYSVYRDGNTIPPVNSSWFYGDAVSSLHVNYKAILTEKDVVQLSGLLDPASVAWELVPFSFVADWFIPIGSYLSARGLAQSVKGEFVRTVTKMGYYCEAYNKPANKTIVILSEPHVLSLEKNVERTVSSTLVVPTPSIKPLSEVPSWRRCANAVALMVQSFR